MPFKLNIYFRDSRLEKVPAFVEFPHRSDQAFLHVSPAVWKLAEADHDRSRFILAHEIGHLKMHRHDALGFSDLTPSELSCIQEQERAEPQANKFADYLLVPEDQLIGFRDAEEIEYMFNVPSDCAQRRLDFVEDKARRRRSRHLGEACPECANFTLVRNGTCLKCDTCGGTTGCS